MTSNEIRYLWDLLRLGLFLDAECEARLMANELYEKCDTLDLKIESEVVDYGLRGGKESLISISQALIAEKNFFSVEKFVLVSYLVVNNHIDPIEALSFLSDTSVRKLNREHKFLVSPLLDTAWHLKQDEDFGFTADIDLQEVRGEWSKILDELKPAS